VITLDLKTKVGVVASSIMSFSIVYRLMGGLAFYRINAESGGGVKKADGGISLHPQGMGQNAVFAEICIYRVVASFFSRRANFSMSDSDPA